MKTKQVIIDGNEAAAYVAHRVSDVMAIYPITPSSPMGEWADQWAAEGVPNLWGTVPTVIEMQSEGGAAGTVHGALQTGALASTFTASQGLLLMIPNMYKIAGELTPAVFHVSARTVATHALSIFGDHSDVMAVRATGFAMLAAGSVQEVHDLALVAHAATLESRVPFVHFFDGFRTSHEVMKIDRLADEVIRTLIDDQWVRAHRARALNPDRPVLRGSAQNPDVFFQAREATNLYYQSCPEVVQRVMDRLGDLTGRRYRLFDYVGAADAERVVVLMGSGVEVAHETVEHLAARGEKVGVVKVRLFRPFVGERLVETLPQTVRSLAVLDRTKEPGAAGEPLYQDVVTAMMEHGRRRFSSLPRVIGGRYGLSSKEFTPAMVKSVLDELDRPEPKNHFTVGITDDVTHLSLDVDEDFSTEDPDVVRAVFYGLGSDGTVGANKNSIKIIGEATEHHVQGYFVYDSKKAGSVTVSHLRFGPETIHSSYLVNRPRFIACHHDGLIHRFDVIGQAEPGAMLLLNTPTPPERVWDTLPADMQEKLMTRRMRLFVVDAGRIARENGLGLRINTIMQTCFFAVSNVMPVQQAVERIKKAIRKSYQVKGEAIVDRNIAAVDRALTGWVEVSLPSRATGTVTRPPTVPDEAPEFVRDLIAPLIRGEGDRLPVSRFPVDGTFPTGTSRWEKRNLAVEIPVWNEQTCIQCNKCVLVCPHAAIRANVYPEERLAGAPPTFKSVAAKTAEFRRMRYSLQVAPEDCTGCTLCVEICPAQDKSDLNLKAINMAPQAPLRDNERENFKFFLDLPEFDRRALKVGTVKGSQFLTPLFEYSGACIGCGETPYVKLLSQLFGDRAVIANATGCSSIYGGNLPTTPWTLNRAGRGPAWSNSLFEDNAEFGLGFRLAIDRQEDFARSLLKRMRSSFDDELVDALLNADQSDERGIEIQRRRVARLKETLIRMAEADGPEGLDARNLMSVVDSLCRRSVWIVGGDGWAYDIGYGGLDHVLASGHDINVLVLDTEVYSNTGGQMSKATPLGAIAKFAAAGKRANKKDLGRLAMSYGNVYVAEVALGANDNHLVKAFVEAERYDGPSLIIAYAHCIAHGIDMRDGLNQQKRAVDCGHWPLYRYDPRRKTLNQNPFQLDSRPPTLPLRDYLAGQNRFRLMLEHGSPDAEALLADAQRAVNIRFKELQRLADFREDEGMVETVSDQIAS